MSTLILDCRDMFAQHKHEFDIMVGGVTFWELSCGAIEHLSGRMARPTCSFSRCRVRHNRFVLSLSRSRSVRRAEHARVHPALDGRQQRLRWPRTLTRPH